MENLRIALVQMQSVVGATESNLKKIKGFAEQAYTKNVDIICFPELAVQGYTRESAYELAESVPGPSSDFLTSTAKQYGIIILAGFIEKSQDGIKPYITQLVCFPDGTQEKYRKTHLGQSEAPYFQPGNELPTFQCSKAKFSLQICWDLHFPELSTIYSLKGAEIIFAPHASPSIVGDRREIWLRYMTARAYDNALFVAACNLVGENAIGSEFGGGALVIGPKGQVLAEDFNNQEGLLIVDLPQEQINKIRYEERTTMRNSYYLEYRRPELYKDIFKK
ncbi:MAG: nitrilase family protein [Bacillota bacterium]